MKDVHILLLLLIQASILHLCVADGKTWNKSDFEKDSKNFIASTQNFIPYDVNYRTKLFQGSQTKKDIQKSIKRSFENSASSHIESGDSSQELNRRRYYKTLSSLPHTRRIVKDNQVINGKNSTEKDTDRQDINTENYKRPMKIMAFDKTGRSNMHKKKTDMLQRYRQLLLKTGQMNKFRNLSKVKQRQFIRHLVLKNRKRTKLKTKIEKNRIHKTTGESSMITSSQVSHPSHVTGMNRVSERVTTDSSYILSNTPSSRNTTSFNTRSDGPQKEKHISLTTSSSHRKPSSQKSYKKDKKYFSENSQKSQKFKKEHVLQHKFDNYQRDNKGNSRNSFVVMTSPKMVDSRTNQPNAFMFNQNGDVVHYRGSPYKTVYPEFEQQRSFAFKSNMQYLRDIPITSQPDFNSKKDVEHSSEVKTDEDNEMKKRRDDKDDDSDNEIKISSSEDKDKQVTHHPIQNRLPATFTIHTKNYNARKSKFWPPRYDFTQPFNPHLKQRRFMRRRKLRLPSNLPRKGLRNKYRQHRRKNRYGMLKETPAWSNYRANVDQPSQFVMISNEHRNDRPIPTKEDQDSSEDTSESEQQYSPPYYHTVNPALNSMDIAGGFQYNYQPYNGNEQLDPMGKMDYYPQYINPQTEENNEDNSDENTSIEQEQGDEADYQEPPSYVDMHGSDVALDTGRVNEMNHVYGESTIVPLGQLQRDKDDDEQDENINSSENAVEDTSEEQDNKKQLPENIHKNRDSPDTLLIVLDDESKTMKHADNEEQNHFKLSSAEDFVDSKKVNPVMKADHSLSNGILVILDNDGAKTVTTTNPTTVVEQTVKPPDEKQKPPSPTPGINISKSSINKVTNKQEYKIANDTRKKYANNIINKNILSNTSSNYTKPTSLINDISFTLNSSEPITRLSLTANVSNQSYRTSLKPSRNSKEKKSSLNNFSNLLIELGTKDNIFNIRAPNKKNSKQIGDYQKGVAASKSLGKDQRFRVSNRSHLLANRYKNNRRKLKQKRRLKNLGRPFKNLHRSGNGKISRRKSFRKFYPNVRFQADTELFGNRVREVVEIPDIDWTLNGSNLEREGVSLWKKSNSPGNTNFTSKDVLEKNPPNTNVIRGIHSSPYGKNVDVIGSRKTDSQPVENGHRYRKIPMEYPKDIDPYKDGPGNEMPNIFTLGSDSKDDEDEYDDDSGENGRSDHNVVVNTLQYNGGMHGIDYSNPVYLNSFKDIRSLVEEHNDDKEDFNEGVDEERDTMKYPDKQQPFHPRLVRSRNDLYNTGFGTQLNQDNPAYRELSGSQEEFPDIDSDSVQRDYHYPKFDQLKTKINLGAGVYQDTLYGIDSDDENEELPLMYRDIIYKKPLSNNNKNTIAQDNVDTHLTSDRNKARNSIRFNAMDNAGTKTNTLDNILNDFRNSSIQNGNPQRMSHGSVSAFYGQFPLNQDDTYDSMEDSHSNSMADEQNYLHDQLNFISSNSQKLHKQKFASRIGSPKLTGSMESQQKYIGNGFGNSMKKKTSSLFEIHLRNRDKSSDDASIRSFEGFRPDHEFYRTSSRGQSQIIKQGKREKKQEIYFPKDFHGLELPSEESKNEKSSLRGQDTQDIPRQYRQIYQLLMEGNLPEKYRKLYPQIKEEIDKIINKSSQVKKHKTFVDKNIQGSNEADSSNNGVKLNNRLSSGGTSQDSQSKIHGSKERGKEPKTEIPDIHLTKPKTNNKVNVVDVHDDMQVALEGVYLKSRLDSNNTNTNNNNNNGIETVETSDKLLLDENISGDFGNDTLLQNSQNWRGTNFDVDISNPKLNGSLVYGQSMLERNVSQNNKDYNTNKLSRSIQYDSFSDHGAANGPGKNNIPPEQFDNVQYKNYLEENPNNPVYLGNGYDLGVDYKGNEVQNKHDITMNSHKLQGKHMDSNQLNTMQDPTDHGGPIPDIIDNQQYEGLYNYHDGGYDPYDYLGGVDISQLDPMAYNGIPDKSLVKFDQQGNRLYSDLTNVNLPQHNLMKDNSDVLTQLVDERNVKDGTGPIRDTPGIGKNGDKFNLISQHLIKEKTGTFSNDLQKSEQVVLDKYLSNDVFQKVYDGRGERQYLQDSYRGGKHSQEHLRERKQQKGKHLQSNFFYDNSGNGKYPRDRNGERKSSRNGFWEGKRSKKRHREGKPLYHSRRDRNKAENSKDINDDEDDSKTQEIDNVLLNDNDLTEDTDDRDSKHHSSGNSYYSDTLGQPMSLTEKNLPQTFQISPSSIATTVATIVHQNKTSKVNRSQSERVDVKEVDQGLFSVTQKKVYKTAAMPSSVSNLEGLDTKWFHPSTNKRIVVQNESLEEKLGKKLINTYGRIISSDSPPFQISNTPKGSEMKETISVRKEIDSTTEKIDAKKSQPSIITAISPESTSYYIDGASMKVINSSIPERLVTFSNKVSRLSHEDYSHTGPPILQIDSNSSQIHKEYIDQADLVNTTNNPNRTPAKTVLTHDESSYDVLPEEGWTDDKNNTEGVDEVHEVESKSSVNNEGAAERWRRDEEGYSIKPTISYLDDKNIDDVPKKDRESDVLVSQIDENEHLLSEIEHGESVPQLPDKKIQRTPGVLPIDRGIHQLHQILPDILVEEPDISHRPTTVPQSTAVSKDHDKHMNISVLSTVPQLDTSKSVSYKVSASSGENIKSIGRTMTTESSGSYLNLGKETTEPIGETKAIVKDSFSANIGKDDVTGLRADEGIFKTTRSEAPRININFETKEDLDYSHQKVSYEVGFKTIPTTYEKSTVPTTLLESERRQSSLLFETASASSESDAVLVHHITEPSDRSSSVDSKITTHDSKLREGMNTLSIPQARKDMEKSNRSLDIRQNDKFDIVKSYNTTTSTGIKKLRRYESTEQSSILQGKDKYPALGLKYSDVMLQSTKKISSHEPTIKTHTLLREEPITTMATPDVSALLEDENMTVEHGIYSSRHKAMEPTTIGKQTHDINRLVSVETVQREGEFFSSGSKYDGDESSTLQPPTSNKHYQMTKLIREESDILYGESSSKPLTHLPDDIKQSSKVKLPHISSDTSHNVDVIKSYEMTTPSGNVVPNITGSIYKDTSFQSVGISGISRTSSEPRLTQKDDILYDKETLGSQQPDVTSDGLLSVNEVEYGHTSTSQKDDTSLDIEKTPRPEQQIVTNASLIDVNKEEIFDKDTEIYRVSNETDRVTRKDIGHSQNISNDVHLSETNKPLHIFNKSRDIDQTKKDEPIQLDAALHGEDLFYGIGSSQPEAIPTEYHRRETAIQNSTHKEIEQTQLDDTLNVGVGVIGETFQSTRELQSTPDYQQPVSIYDEPQFSMDVTIVKPTQVNRSRQLTNLNLSQLDVSSDGFTKLYGEDKHDKYVPRDISESHSYTQSKSVNTLINTEGLTVHEPLETDSRHQKHKTTLTDGISPVINIGDQLSQIVLTSSSTSELKTSDPSRLDGVFPDSQNGKRDSQISRLEGIDSYVKTPEFKQHSQSTIDPVSSQGNGISFGLSKSELPEQSHRNDGKYSMTERSKVSEIQHDVSNSSSHRYDTTHQPDILQITGVFKSDESMTSDAELYIIDALKQGDKNQKDDSAEMTSFAALELDNKHQETDQPPNLNELPHITQYHLGKSDVKSHIIDKVSQDKITSNKPSRTGRILTKPSDSETLTSTKYATYMDGDDKSTTTDDSLKKSEVQGVFLSAKSDMSTSIGSSTIYKPVKVDGKIPGSTKSGATPQDMDTLPSYVPTKASATSHDTSKLGRDYLATNMEEVSQVTGNPTDQESTKVFDFSPEVDYSKSLETSHIEGSSQHTFTYSKRKTYRPTKIDDSTYSGDKSESFHSTRKANPSVAPSVPDSDLLIALSEPSANTFTETSKHDFIPLDQWSTIKSTVRPRVITSTSDTSVLNGIPGTDHRVYEDKSYRVSTDKYHSKDEKIMSPAQVRREKVTKYQDVYVKVDKDKSQFVSSRTEPTKDIKVLPSEAKLLTENYKDYTDDNTIGLEKSDAKTNTFTKEISHEQTSWDDLDNLAIKASGTPSVSSQPHRYLTDQKTNDYLSTPTDDKHKKEKYVSKSVSLKQEETLSSVKFPSKVTKGKLIKKSPDIFLKHTTPSPKILFPALQTFSGTSGTSRTSSKFDAIHGQKRFQTLLDLPSTLLFGQLMDVNLQSKAPRVEKPDKYSSIKAGGKGHFTSFDSLPQFKGSLSKESKKPIKGSISDFFSTKQLDMKFFTGNKTPASKPPTVKFEKQNVDVIGFTKYLDDKIKTDIRAKNDSSQLLNSSTESVPAQSVIEKEFVQKTPVTSNPQTNTEDRNPILEDSTKIQSSLEPGQPGFEPEQFDEGVPLPEYTSFVNYKDSIDQRTSTSELPSHRLTTFYTYLIETNQKENLFPKTSLSHIPFYETPVLDFTEDDRKIPVDKTTEKVRFDFPVSQKQQLHIDVTKTETPYIESEYPSTIEQFNRSDFMKFHIPGDTSASINPDNTLSLTSPSILIEKSAMAIDTMGNTKSSKHQSNNILQTTTPFAYRSIIKKIWEDSSSLMLNLYETSRFTKASLLRQKKTAYYLVESVDNVAKSLKLDPVQRETCSCYFTKETVEISCEQEVKGRLLKLTVPSKRRDENMRCQVKTYDDIWKGSESCMEGHKYCDHMFGTRFRKCIQQLGKENLLKYYTMCNTVMCRDVGDMQQWKNDACDVIDALAYECEIIGIKVSWREITKCYKQCPENMAFKHNVSTCRITCDNYNTEIQCPTEETESRCDCKEGYVLSKETCVPVQECGCVYEGYFLEVGQTVTLPGCNMMAVCVRDKFGWSSIKYHELPGCSPRESCHFVNESYECIVHCGGEVCHENATCEEDKCRCHVGLYGDGVTTCKSTLGVCSCLVSGLSRYRTYDGQMIHYLSTCPIELTSTVATHHSTDTRLSVFSTTLFSRELMMSFGTRRYRTVNVTINGLNIYMDTSGKTYVDNVKIALPFKDNEVNISISNVAGWITICSDDGVSVSYDRRHRIKMFLPKEYRGKLSGICGNCNGVHDELKTKYNKHETSHEIIGQSYSLNTSHSCGPVRTKKCERGIKRCELMRSGMFADCHPYLDDGLVQSYYDSCMHMTCAFRSYTDYMDKLTCAALESLDTECMSRGYIVEWRSQRLCPVSCCRPMVYEQHVNETEESCVPSIETCPIRPVDGCTCGEGYVLDNNKCVLPRDCGCWYNNSLYIQLGETIHLPGCNVMVECRKVATGKRNLIETNLPEGCGNNSMCLLKDHKYQCVCEDGFARNKNDTFCLKIPECGDQPVDVVFVVDVSGSINVTGLNSTKHFLTHFINSTNIGKNHMQISVLLFNDKPHSLFHLNKYTDKRQMLDSVYKIGPPEGTTYLGRALVFVALVSLQEKMGAREHVNRAVVILTDGVLHDAERAERWGALLRRRKKAELFAIGVGEADPAQLQRLTRNRNNVFYVREYVQLNGIMDILLQSVCM